MHNHFSHTHHKTVIKLVMTPTFYKLNKVFLITNITYIKLYKYYKYIYSYRYMLVKQYVMYSK